MRLVNKRALITGAARGIGRGIAQTFAKEGAIVGVIDLDFDECQRVVEEIQTTGGQAIALPADIRYEEQVQTAVEKFKATFGACNVLVNNAAVMPAGRLHELRPDDFDRTIAVNLRGTYLMCRAVIPDMLVAQQGSIIHMASITGVRGLPGIAGYSATKGALIALARAMSTDYARLGIRVNCVSPGTIDSPMLHDFLDAQTNKERLRGEFDAMHPIGRVGTIQEVANVFVFLASDEASFVTGSNYEVDGGLASKGEQPQD